MPAKKQTVKAQPMICVKDVEASSRWYQRLVSCESGHGGKEYEMLLSGGDLVLQLHLWDAHEHPDMGDPGKAVGNGVLLWFAASDFDEVVEQARKLKAKIVQEPRVNPNAGHREIWLRDPDGYLVVVAGK
jgi:hypothetical protein